MLITVIDYGSGNLRSATKAFEKAAEDRPDIRVLLTDKAEDVRKADRIVLPGQGAFADCMKGLSSVPGMRAALDDAVRARKKPFFGICVGMQLLAQRGLEHGHHEGLGWLDGEVRPLAVNDNSLKIPHMGWNTLQFRGCEVAGLEKEKLAAQPCSHASVHPLSRNLPLHPAFYFVHSYALYLGQKEDELASCTYGGAFTAAIAKGNIAGTQFHPEKSQKLGLQLIRNFLDWQP